jgi:hypothetical protein
VAGITTLCVVVVIVAFEPHRRERWLRDFRAVYDAHHDLRVSREARGSRVAGARERELATYLDDLDSLAKATPPKDWPPRNALRPPPGHP